MLLPGLWAGPVLEPALKLWLLRSQRKRLSGYGAKIRHLRRVSHGRFDRLVRHCQCLVVLVILFAGRTAVVQAQEPQITLMINLKEGNRYSRRQFREECHRKLGTPLLSQEQEAPLIEMTVAEKGALLLAKHTGLLDVHFEPDRLTIWLQNPESDEARREQRHRLERLFGVSLSEWPAGKGLHVPEEYDPQQRTVLLIHGLEGDLPGLQRLADACAATGFQVLQFDYPNTGPIAWSGDRLRQDLSKFAQEHPAARLVVIAHSMGGLVTRYCLETSEPRLDCVSDVVFLGTPHQGSVLAAEGDLLAVFQKPVHSKEDFLRKLHDGLGEARADLAPQSTFLRTLNARSRPKEVHYHVAIGTESFVTADQSAEILDLLRRRLEDPDLSAGLRVRWQRVVEAPEWVPGEGDGAVSVTSADLPGATNVRRFQLNHLELKDLPGQRPQESPVFRWILKVVQHRESGEP